MRKRSLLSDTGRNKKERYYIAGKTFSWAISYGTGWVGGWLLEKKKKSGVLLFLLFQAQRVCLAETYRKGSLATLPVLMCWGHPDSQSQNSLWILFCSLNNLITRRIKNRMPARFLKISFLDSAATSSFDLYWNCVPSLSATLLQIYYLEGWWHHLERDQSCGHLSTLHRQLLLSPFRPLIF